MIKAAQHVCICVVIVGGLVYAPTSRALINEENPGVAVAKGLFDVVVTLWGAARAAVEHVIDCAQFPGACNHMVDPEHAQSVNQFLVPFLAKKTCTNVDATDHCMSQLGQDIIARVQSAILFSMTNTQRTMYSTCTKSDQVKSRGKNHFAQQLELINHCVKKVRKLDRVRTLLLQHPQSNAPSLLLILALCKNNPNKMKCIKQYVAQENGTIINQAVNQMCVSDPNMSGRCTSTQKQAVRAHNNEHRKQIIKQFEQAKTELTNICAAQIASIHEEIKEEERYRSAHIQAKRMLGSKKIVEHAQYASWINQRNNRINDLERAYHSVVLLCELLAQWEYLYPFLLGAMTNEKIVALTKKTKEVRAAVINQSGSNDIIRIRRK